MFHTDRLRGLYAITPDSGSLPQLLQMVEAALVGGACLLQYRRKRTPAEQRDNEAKALLLLCRKHQVPLIINDDVPLTARIGADGVHLGRDDGGADAARVLLGPRALIGVSCYDSLPLAEAAVAAAANYVAFGSVYSSIRKPDAPRASLALLRKAAAYLPVPVCAIGGITQQNAPEVVATGVAMLAVIGGVFEQTDPRAAASSYRDLFAPGSD